MVPVVATIGLANHSHGSARTGAGFGKKASFGKGVFQKSPEILEILENLEILEILENLQTLENKGGSDYFLEILENVDVRESRF